LKPFFAERGLDPPPWADLVEMSRIDLNSLPVMICFRASALDLLGRADLACAIGERSLRHRNPDT
jgi:hypothetical protein